MGGSGLQFGIEILNSVLASTSKSMERIIGSRIADAKITQGKRPKLAALGNCQKGSPLFWPD
jgi:hypothetical protein